MEHRLITGGFEYLPFARSCIQKLKNTGLTYASQTYEIDGVNINVRIANGQEFIRIDGGLCSIPMDSGVMDVINLGLANVARYYPGVLHEAGDSSAYNAQFTTINSKGYKTNPSKANDGQLSGVLSAGSKFRGAIPDIAYSFYPHLNAVTPATDPPTKEPSTSDDLLLTKKVCGVYCPASVFTGKCRQYVQAMYGQPLYDKYGQGDNPQAPLSVEIGIPALLVAGYSVNGSDAGSVWLNTSCGVKLDENGKHWLFRVSMEGIVTYPLIASPCGEKLRKFLKATNNTLNATSKEHLEAYILSTCRPDVAKAQFFDLSAFLAEAGLYSMGFGWHWNWDGTRADLVKNNVWEQDVLNAAMESWHYTITVTQAVAEDGTSTFSFAGANPGGKVRWAVTRGLVAISEPIHLTQTLIKTTPKYTDLFVHPKAPFYAFYQRNNLILCTVETTYTEPHTEYTTSHNGDTLAGWGTRYYSQGDRSEWWEKRNYSSYYKFIIDIPGMGSVDVHRAKAYTKDRAEVKDKTRTGPAVSAEGSIGFNTISTPLGTISGWMHAGMHYPLAWTVNVASGNGAIVGNAAIVIPMHDAEAIHRSFGSSDTSTFTVTEEQQSGYMPWDYGYRVWPTSDTSGPYEDYIWWTTGGYQSSMTGYFPISTFTDTDLTSTGDESLLYSRSVTPIVFGSAIHDLMDTNLEETLDPFRTITSADGKAVYVLSHLTPPIGIADEIAQPVFVGWV